jgi:hypothetical protein
MCAGTAAGIGVIYMTSEWKGKDLLQYIPVYNRKINFTPNEQITVPYGGSLKIPVYNAASVADPDPRSSTFLTPGSVISMFRISDPVCNPQFLR